MIRRTTPANGSPSLCLTSTISRGWIASGLSFANSQVLAPLGSISAIVAATVVLMASGHRLMADGGGEMILIRWPATKVSQLVQKYKRRYIHRHTPS